ncbi:hypothetical protein BKA62DRAFT_761184 [Auriculariales sp. MPI-PUGE-AT-0066]|nr:hypothetical protein BKA62DRAFT_761184 [Auriculariales sp. MPI-PUGE-AT-0066]
MIEHLPTMPMSAWQWTPSGRRTYSPMRGIPERAPGRQPVVPGARRARHQATATLAAARHGWLRRHGFREASLALALRSWMFIRSSIEQSTWWEMKYLEDVRLFDLHLLCKWLQLDALKLMRDWRATWGVNAPEPLQPIHSVTMDLLLSDITCGSKAITALDGELLSCSAAATIAPASQWTTRRLKILAQIVRRDLSARFKNTPESSKLSDARRLRDEWERICCGMDDDPWYVSAMMIWGFAIEHAVELSATAEVIEWLASGYNLFIEYADIASSDTDLGSSYLRDLHEFASSPPADATSGMATSTWAIITTSATVDRVSAEMRRLARALAFLVHVTAAESIHGRPSQARHKPFMSSQPKTTASNLPCTTPNALRTLRDTEGFSQANGGSTRKRTFLRSRTTSGTWREGPQEAHLTPHALVDEIEAAGAVVQIASIICRGSLQFVEQSSRRLPICIGIGAGTLHSDEPAGRLVKRIAERPAKVVRWMRGGPSQQTESETAEMQSLHKTGSPFNVSNACLRVINRLEIIWTFSLITPTLFKS